MKVLVIFAVFIAFAAAAAVPLESQSQTQAQPADQHSALLSADVEPKTDNIAERSKRFIFFKKIFVPFPISVTKYVAAPVAYAAPVATPVVTPIVQR